MTLREHALEETGSTLSFPFDFNMTWSCSCSAICSQRFHAFRKVAKKIIVKLENI